MFEFSSSADKDSFLSLRSLAKYNAGFFKTAKQANYLYKHYSKIKNSEASTYLGITLADGQVDVTVNGYSRWANYGARSIIPGIIVFVIDKVGVVAQYKIRGKGNLRDGWGPDLSKTELIWSRPADAVCPWTFEPEPVAPSIRSNEWLGYPGDKIEVTLKFIRGREMGCSRWGDMYLSVFEDELGNLVNVWKHFDLEVNETMKVKGTVKSTDDYKGRKQTTLIRVKAVV